MAPRPTVLILGDINVDVFVPVDKFAGLGHDYLVPRLDIHPGGVAVNTALALRRWGARVRLLGAVGRDALGEFMLRELHRRGVDTRLVQKRKGALTGLMCTVVNERGERTFFGSRGANADVRSPEGAGQWLRGVEALHLMGYNFLSRVTAKTAKRVLGEARRRGLPVSFDVGMGPARQAARTILPVLGQVDILFLSRDEARLLTRQRRTAEALKTLERLGTRQVVLKLGKGGCLLRANGVLTTAPGFRVAPIDTTGCGDAFAAAFLTAQWKGWPVEEAALAANATGAAAATIVGAGEQLPGPAAAAQLLRRHHLPRGWEAVRRRVVGRLRNEFARR